VQDLSRAKGKIKNILLATVKKAMPGMKEVFPGFVAQEKIICPDGLSNIQ